jgi:PAS domain S-box-containing protein
MRHQEPDVVAGHPAERGGRALLETLPLVTYTLRLRPPFHSLYVSPQLGPLFGFDADDCVGNDGFWSSKIHQEDLPRFRAALERTASTHEQLSVVYRVHAGGGRQVWVRDVGVVAIDGDELVLHGYLSDVTREQELEAELER